MTNNKLSKLETENYKKEDYHEQSSRYYWSFFKGSQIEKNYSFSGIQILE